MYLDKRKQSITVLDRGTEDAVQRLTFATTDHTRTKLIHTVVQHGTAEGSAIVDGLESHLLKIRW